MVSVKQVKKMVVPTSPDTGWGMTNLPKKYLPTLEPSEVVAETCIVCAANRFHGGEIVLGLRHFDNLMYLHIMAIEKCSTLDFKECEQGFITNKGEFVDRNKAYEIALKAGQINFRRPKSGGEGSTTLYSEDLY